jgi:diacylglycerol kinase (ATP)
VVAMRRAGPIALIVNPAAEHAARLPNLLHAAGINIGEQIAVGDLEAMRPHGASWRRRGYAAVVAAGGDGTIGAATSQIAESDLPLGILPLGTSNDVARALSIPLDLSAACAVIANGLGHGLTTAVDVGVVIPAPTSTVSSSGLERTMQPRLRDRVRGVARRLLPPGSLRGALAGPEIRFIHAVTLGLNVEFARLATDVARRRRWGPLNYAAASVEALTKLRPVSVTLRLSGISPTASHLSYPEHSEQARPDVRRHSRYSRHVRGEDELVVACQTVQVAVVNTPVFGGALNMRLPAADPRDRRLDVVVIEALEPRLLRETVEELLAALAPQPSTQSSATEAEEIAADSLLLTEEAARFALPGVHHYQVRGVRIEAPAGVDITLDGEIGARTPAEVCLAGKQIQVLLPA